MSPTFGSFQLEALLEGGQIIHADHATREAQQQIELLHHGQLRDRPGGEGLARLLQAGNTPLSHPINSKANINSYCVPVSPP